MKKSPLIEKYIGPKRQSWLKKVMLKNHKPYRMYEWDWLKLEMALKQEYKKLCDAQLAKEEAR